MPKLIFLLFFCKFFILIWGKSLTFVLDTTETMKFEMDYIANAMTNFDVANFVDDYVLVPFNQPEVGPVTVATSLNEFKKLVSNITSFGKRECSDIVLEAIQRGLEKSSPESHIYVFSDADVEDGNTYEIKKLCKSTNSRVSIIATKTCLPQVLPQDIIMNNVYQDIADSCGGQLIMFNPYNLRYVFKFIEEVIQWDTIDFRTDHSVKCDGMEHQVSVDNYVAEVLILFIGNISPDIMNRNETNQAVILINSRNFKVFHIKEPRLNFKVKCRSHGHAIIKIGECSQFDFKIGFSPIKPTTMIETTSRPIPNLDWFTLIEALEVDLEPKELEIHLPGREEKKYKLFQTHRGSKLYVSESFRVPDRTFRIIIIATDESGALTRHKSQTIPVQDIVTSGTPTPCSGTILDTYEDNNIVNYGSDRHLVCKVTGYPAPSVWWSPGYSEYETKMLEYPNVFLSYVYLKNILGNGTYNCNFKNKDSSGKASTDVFVKFTSKFIVMEEPEDMVLDVYSEGTLNCKVDAYPPATVKWFQNDTLMVYKPNIDMYEGSLTIKKMDFDDIGTYTCKIENAFETRSFTADVSISGLEYPSVSIDREDVIKVEGGNSLEIECTAQGKPFPEIRWAFRTNMSLALENLPSGVSDVDGRLIIKSVKPHHKGFYRCEAINEIGSDCLDVEIQTGSPPIIEEGYDLITVKENHAVEIPCKVHSASEPRVWWEFSQSGIEVVLDDRHKIDKSHTLSFVALWKDSGIYKCIAESEEGRSERDTIVDVQVPPYIKPASPKEVSVVPGQQYNLPCIVEYGNPGATLSWRFKPKNAIRAHDIGSSSENLVLKSFSLHDAGEYICSAENSVGYDQIKYILHPKLVH